MARKTKKVIIKYNKNKLIKTLMIKEWIYVLLIVVFVYHFLFLTNPKSDKCELQRTIIEEADTTTITLKANCDMKLYEIIPKCAAKDISEITLSSNTEVIADDPVIKINMQKYKQYKYSINHTSTQECKEYFKSKV